MPSTDQPVPTPVHFNGVSELLSLFQLPCAIAVMSASCTRVSPRQLEKVSETRRFISSRKIKRSTKTLHEPTFSVFGKTAPEFDDPAGANTRPHGCRDQSQLRNTVQDLETFPTL